MGVEVVVVAPADMVAVCVCVCVGENGYQAWAIMSPYGSAEIEGTY